MSKRLLGAAFFAVLLGAVFFAFTLLVSGQSGVAGRASAAADTNQTSKVQAKAQPNGSWADIAPFPTVSVSPTPGTYPLKLKRAGAAAYPPNGKIYVMGGRHGTDGEDVTLQWIWEYTPGNPGSWTRKNALLDGSQPGSRYTANMAVAVLTDTGGVHVYAIGGSSINSEPTPAVRVYDPVADSVNVLGSDDWPANPPRIPGAYAVYNNKLYIFGGFSAIGNGAVFSDTWVFDPMGAAGAKWTQLASANLGTARGYMGGAALDGYIYAIGGDTWDSTNHTLIPANNVERMDPRVGSPTWTSMASLPTARGDLGAWAYNTGTGYEISGRIAVAGGIYPTPDNTGYLYNPSTNSWGSFPSMVHATRNYGVAQLDGYLYAFGGYDYSGGIPAGANFNQRYDATQPIGTPTNTPTQCAGCTNTPTHTAVAGTPTNTPTATGTVTPCAVVNLLTEGFESNTLGAFESVVGVCVPGGCGWTPAGTPHSGSHAAFAPDPNNISDQYLQTTNTYSIPAGSAGAELSFWNNYATENTFDGGVLETSTDNGATWQDILDTSGNAFITGAYNGSISTNFQSPIAGRDAWTGDGGGYIQTRVNLAGMIGRTFKIRFRMASDNSVSATGWTVDDISLSYTSSGGCGTPVTNTPTPQGGTPTATPCSGVFQGSLDPGDPQQTGRLTRDGTASACGVQDACPGVFDPTGSRAYDQYSIPNNSGSSVCATITVDTACTGTNYVFIVAYLDSFDPNNLCGNYLGDSGSSPEGSISFGVDVPTGHTLIVVVHEVTPGAGCSAYTLTVDGLGQCATPATETATSTQVPSSTSTATTAPTNTNTPTTGPGTITATTEPGTTTPTATTEPGSPTVTSTPCTISFTDVHTTDYFYEDVRCVYCLGAVSGYSDGTFRPFNNTTRGQMTKIIVLALQIPIATPTGTPTFNDVPAGSTFYDYIETAAGAGIVSGYSDGSFRPNNNVTRGQLSKIDVIAASQVFSWELLNPATPTFTDVPPGSAFYEYIETAVCHGIISGYADNTFRPNNNAIRAQIAKIVCRTSQNPADACAPTPTTTP